MENGTLPNLLTTWKTLKGGEQLEPFNDWVKKYELQKQSHFSSDTCAKIFYLKDMIKRVSSQSHCREGNELYDELNLVYLNLRILGDDEYANKFIAGYRMNPVLDERYIQKTKCYG
ncbi:hypothetical protein KFE26_21430 [Shewanella sp. M16]|uniref:hypothetical protein n=1 Tax=Shewanella sp. M16 TaxID=2830837 RepID=UPI001BB0B8F8|nr:hypothetical protein [Shewanella sp. M16]MBS0044832.1 hypothetical protein [Shewanella sp. M16]